MALNIPVVFIIFNRPQNTSLVFEKIRAVRPSRLYIIADAPRDNNEEDITNCNKSKEIVEKVDWNCKVGKKYSAVNLGCGINISEGISWVFEQEEMAIILEDDCIPATPFFSFCEELLLKYKDDSRIMHIGGTNWHPEFRTRDNESYFFSKNAHIWGWATWKRAWNLFDYEMKDYPKFINNGYYKDVITLSQEQRYFKERWDSFYRTNYIMKSVSNWDYQWYYTVLKNNGLCIWPSSNLVCNIGIAGTHTNKFVTELFFRPVDENYKIEKHPQFVIKYGLLDEYHYWHHNHKSLVAKLVNRTIKIIKKMFRLIH